MILGADVNSFWEVPSEYKSDSWFSPTTNKMVLRFVDNIQNIFLNNSILISI